MRSAYDRLGCDGWIGEKIHNLPVCQMLVLTETQTLGRMEGMQKSSRAYAFRRRLFKLTTLFLLSYCVVVWSGVVLIHSGSAHAMSVDATASAKSLGGEPFEEFTGGKVCKMLCKAGTCAGFGVLDRSGLEPWSIWDLRLKPVGTGPPPAWQITGPLKPPRLHS